MKINIKNKWGCKWCWRAKKSNKPFCNAERSDWICTRELGHAGPHVACGTLGHAYHIWEDGDDK